MDPDSPVVPLPGFTVTRDVDWRLVYYRFVQEASARAGSFDAIKYVSDWLLQVAIVPPETFDACTSGLDPSKLQVFVLLPCGFKKSTVITSVTVMSRVVRHAVSASAGVYRWQCGDTVRALLSTKLITVVVVPVLVLGRQHQRGYWFGESLDLPWPSSGDGGAGSQPRSHVHGGGLRTFLWNNDSMNPGPLSPSDHYDIVFVTPEGLGSHAFGVWDGANVWRIYAVFIDEAHYLLTDASYRRSMLCIG